MPKNMDNVTNTTANNTPAEGNPALTSGGGATSGANANLPASRQELRATAQQTTQQVQQQAQQTANKMQQQIKSQANAQLATASHGLDTFAQTVRDFSQDLRNRKEDTIAQYTDKAADQIEHLSDYLQKDVTDIIEDANNFARRQPAVVLLGAFVLGFLGSRFLKSSSPSSSQRRGGNQGQFNQGPGYRPRYYTSRPQNYMPPRYAQPTNPPMYGRPGSANAPQSGQPRYNGYPNQPDYQPDQPGTQPQTGGNTTSPRGGF